jgi:hypothetical protein
MTTATNAANFSVIDNNDYYVDGCNGQIGFMNFETYPNIPDWQAATGQEAHSLGVNPLFTTPNYLMPTNLSMPKAGSYVSTIPVDITGAMRTSPPDMGAYEFAYGMSAQTTAATNVSPASATLNGILNPAGQSANVFFDYGQSASYGSVVAGTPPVVSGNTPSPVSAVLTNLPAGTWHFRVRMVSFGNVTVFGNDMTFSTMPDSLTVTGTAGSGSNDCYSATSVIIVAGNGSSFLVQNGGSATFVAGQKIRFMPGTKVLAGGYMHGYITTNGEYCNNLDNALVSNPDNTESELKSTSDQIGDMAIRIYPNPVTSSFTLDLSNLEQNSTVRMEIFTMSGVKVKEETLTGSGSYRFAADHLPVGLYFVRISDGIRIETVKLVKL